MNVIPKRLIHNSLSYHFLGLRASLKDGFHSAQSELLSPSDLAAPSRPHVSSNRQGARFTDGMAKWPLIQFHLLETQKPFKGFVFRGTPQGRIHAVRLPKDF